MSSARERLEFTYKTMITETGYEISVKTDIATAYKVGVILSSLKHPFKFTRFGLAKNKSGTACYMDFAFPESQSMKKEILDTTLAYLREGRSLKYIEKEIESAIEFYQTIDTLFKEKSVILKQSLENFNSHISKKPSESKEPQKKIQPTKFYQSNGSKHLSLLRYQAIDIHPTHTKKNYSTIKFKK